jgi:hypothetical protein
LCVANHKMGLATRAELARGDAFKDNWGERWDLKTPLKFLSPVDRRRCTHWKKSNC